MNRFLTWGATVILSFCALGVMPAYAAFLSSLDIGSPPSLLEIGGDYVLLEIPPQASAKGYKVFYSDKPFRGDEKTYVQVEGKNIALVQHLQPGIRYYFTAVAYDNTGNESESFSPSVSLKLALEGQSSLLDYTTPFKPELNIADPATVTKSNDGTVTVSWKPLTDAAYYKLYVAEDQPIDRSFHPFIKVFGGASTGLSNLRTDVTYHFGVVAVDRAGYESSLVTKDALANFSEMESMHTDASLALHLPPASIFVDQYKRTIRWESVGEASSYIVWKSRYPFRDSMFSSLFQAAETTNNTFWTVGADPEEPIFYVAVQAVSKDGRKGPLSEPVKVVFPHDGKRKFLGMIFQDIDESSWYASALVYLLHEGVVNKNTEHRFHPGDNITRAAFAKMLLELRRIPLVAANTPNTHVFCDVNYSAWYGTYVASMTQYRFTQGYAGGSCSQAREFRPDKNVSRAEALRFLFQAFQIDPKTLVGSNPSDFQDVKPTDWYYADVVFASRINLVSGYVRDGKKYYDPHRTITRAEAAQLMYKFITQLDYQYHQDNTDYLYTRYDTRYRLALNVAGTPQVDVQDEGVSVSWLPVNSAFAYRVLLTPERVLDKTTRNLMVISVPADTVIKLSDGSVGVLLPRAYLPGDFYSVSLIAFDDELNESLDYSGVATIALDPLPNANALEDKLFVPEEAETQPVPGDTIMTDGDTTVRDDTPAPAVTYDEDCRYVGMFEDQTQAGYQAYLATCSSSYTVAAMTDCLNLSSRTDQVQCLMLQGYKQKSSTLCNKLSFDDAQACLIGVALDKPTVLDCSRVTILPRARCEFYVKTATALTTSKQTPCDTLNTADQLLCVKTYVHLRYTASQCTSYAETNASLISSKNPVALAIVDACNAFHSESGTLDQVQSLEDQKRQSDLQFLSSLFGKYANEIGSFPISSGECLDVTSGVRKLLVDRQLIDNTRFPVDPVTNGNNTLCPNKGGVYYYKSLSLSGQANSAFVLVAELEEPTGSVPLLTLSEFKNISSYGDLKALLDKRAGEKNPVGATFYLHLGK